MGTGTFSPVDQIRWDNSTERTIAEMTCTCHYAKDMSEQTTHLALPAAKNVPVPKKDLEQGSNWVCGKFVEFICVHKWFPRKNSVSTVEKGGD